MKTLLWFIGLIALLNGCKRDDPQPEPTQVKMTVVDQTRNPLPNIDVIVFASTGSYFGGSRKDSIFARLITDATGVVVYQAAIESKWRVYIHAYPPFDNVGPIYDVSTYEGTIDGVVNVGQNNVITAVLTKR